MSDDEFKTNLLLINRVNLSNIASFRCQKLSRLKQVELKDFHAFHYTCIEGLLWPLIFLLKFNGIQSILSVQTLDWCNKIDRFAFFI